MPLPPQQPSSGHRPHFGLQKLVGPTRYCICGDRSLVGARHIENRYPRAATRSSSLYPKSARLRRPVTALRSSRAVTCPASDGHYGGGLCPFNVQRLIAICFRLHGGQWHMTETLPRSYYSSAMSGALACGSITRRSHLAPLLGYLGPRVVAGKLSRRGRGRGKSHGLGPFPGRPVVRRRRRRQGWWLPRTSLRCGRP